MRPIHPLELVGNEKSDFDLYDDKGNLIYKRGEPLTPEMLMKFSYKKLFVKERRLSSETHLLTGNKVGISEKATKFLINNTKDIIKKVYEDEKVDLKSCTDAADIITEEVSGKLEKIECISQLRIFDEYTFSHTVNVSSMSSAIGMILDFDENQIKELALGALLHDIGKMLVPKDILNKPAKLDPEEFEIMKSHTLLGYNYIRQNLDIPDIIAKVALDHQEKYNGSGYPNGLKSKEINLYAQVTSIADVFDALISNRVYKRGMEPEKAVKIMLSEEGTSFNPYILSKFLKITNYKPVNNSVDET